MQLVFNFTILPLFWLQPSSRMVIEGVAPRCQSPQPVGNYSVTAFIIFMTADYLVNVNN